MLQWLKRSLASFLGDKKDIVKNLPKNTERLRGAVEKATIPSML